MAQSAHEELAQLVAAFRTRLSWAERHGQLGVPAAPSPRFQPASVAEDRAGDELPDPVEQVGVTLEQVREELGECQRCRLAETRKSIVFGEGNSSADLMFIGEAPGGDEDKQGRPFVGKAGQLLTRMIGAMGLDREQVYIGNIIKCRPPRNRDPQPDEIDCCEPFLKRQIDAIGPRIIVALGGFAAKTLLRSDRGISQLRGRFHTYHGIALMPTFHPAYLLRNPERKRPVWEDLQQVMAEMDRLGIERNKR